MDFFGPAGGPCTRCRVKTKQNKKTNSRPPAEDCLNRYRAHIDLELGEACVFCTETETLAPLFGQRPRLSSLFDIIKKKNGFRDSGKEFPYDF